MYLANETIGCVKLTRNQWNRNRNLPDFGRLFLLTDVREGPGERPHAGPPVVDSEGLPIEHVRETLRSISLNDTLATVQTNEVEHIPT